MSKSQKILYFVPAANPAHPIQPPHFYPQSHPIQPPHFYPQSHPIQLPHFYPQSHPIQPPHFYPQSHPIQPPHFYPQSHPIQPPHFYPQSHPIQPPYFYPQSHPIQPPHFYPQSHPIQPPHFYPQSHPIQPPYFYPQSHPIQPPHFYPSSHPAMPAHFYPTPSMMEMKQHHSSIPSVQQYPLATPAGFCPPDGYMHNEVYYPTPQPPQHTRPLLAKKERTLCEDEGVQDGSIITPQTPATDVLTLVCPDEQVPPVYTLWPVPAVEPQPTSDLPPDQSSRVISEASLSTPTTPSSLAVAEIMEAEKAEPSTLPTPTPLTLGEIMEAEESEPATPPTPPPLTGGEIMDGEEAEPYKVPPPTPLTVVEIKEQTVDIDEIVNGIWEWIKDQVMKDKTKKFPIDKSHHSKYPKCEDEGVQDGSIITPQTPATDVLTLVCPDEQAAPVYTSPPVPELEPQPTSDLPPDQSSDAISEASLSTSTTPSSPTLSEIMEAEEAEPSTPPTPSSLTLGEIMEAEPSTPPTPSSPTLSEIMEAEEADPSTPPTPSSLTLSEIMEAEEADPSTPPTPSSLTLSEIMEAEEAEPSTPPTPSSLTLSEIMEAEKAEPSTPPTPTPLTLGEIMEAEKSEPSTPPTPPPLTGGEIMDGEEAEPYKVPPPTPLTVVEIKEQTLDIDEIVKSIWEWIKDQVMKDKTKKFPMDKSHHSKYPKRVELFIKSLDYSVDDKRLHKEFLPFGAVVSAKVVMENGRSKGFGYVSYSSTNEAMEAIKGMNGKMLGRRPIHVALSNSREECKPHLTWTEQKTGSSRPTNPRQSQHKDTQRVQSQPSHRVWIVGDSYVRRSEARARETMGTNLGVASQVEWFCRGGMYWGELLYFFKQCLEGRTAPDVLVIHCGGNDLGRVERLLLLRTMKRDLFELHRQFPQMKILFSSINQRRQWQHGLPGKVEKVRMFVNNEMATFVSYINGSFVPHPHIQFNKPELYLRDGVHLSPKGHDIFLTGIVQCLRDLNP
ncbi:cell surface glycoprotein 1-like isoform X2 [Ictalurus furcatus]|uniref:cell surface glycoprotein 1-like isoform X2 n=1 Tax=Ictalurus furcatus TaxID=66913 RepID=UPI00234FCD9A|nr:cell surface glycoprotein 1-like isoform X2 [Ictalurus furcatus]